MLPVSLTSTARCPLGPTSRTSRSSGKVWLTLLSVTSTSVMVPPTPATVIGARYGVAGPELGTVTAELRLEL